MADSEERKKTDSDKNDSVQDTEINIKQVGNQSADTADTENSGHLLDVDDKQLEGDVLEISDTADIEHSGHHLDVGDKQVAGDVLGVSDIANLEHSDHRLDVGDTQLAGDVFGVPDTANLKHSGHHLDVGDKQLAGDVLGVSDTADIEHSGHCLDVSDKQLAGDVSEMESQHSSHPESPSNAPSEAPETLHIPCITSGDTVTASLNEPQVSDSCADAIASDCDTLEAGKIQSDTELESTEALRTSQTQVVMLHGERSENYGEHELLAKASLDMHVIPNQDLSSIPPEEDMLQSNPSSGESISPSIAMVSESDCHTLISERVLDASVPLDSTAECMDSMQFDLKSVNIDSSLPMDSTTVVISSSCVESTPELLDSSHSMDTTPGTMNSPFPVDSASAMKDSSHSMDTTAGTMNSAYLVHSASAVRDSSDSKHTDEDLSLLTDSRNSNSESTESTLPLDSKTVNVNSAFQIDPLSMNSIGESFKESVSIIDSTMNMDSSLPSDTISCKVHMDVTPPVDSTEPNTDLTFSHESTESCEDSSLRLNSKEPNADPTIPVEILESTEPNIDASFPRKSTDETMESLFSVVQPEIPKDSSNDSTDKVLEDTVKATTQVHTEVMKESAQTENEEPEFTWETYLEQTGSVAAPPHAFKHVEASLESGFIKGMKLEVPNKCCEDTYWVASVVMTCGQLLRLRFDGYEDDKSADFWCDLMTSEIHPIGWCAQNNQVLQPPEDIKDKFEDWREFLVRSLTGARTAPSYLLDKTTGITPVDQLKPGMRLEIQHPINPIEVWFVTIIENIGGRLYLRFEGAESGGHDFWLFYLNHRLHPLGWAQTQGFTYKPPKELFLEEEMSNCEEIWQTILREDEQSSFSHSIFRDQEEILPHTFQVGQKLEALSPLHHSQVCPATVIEVLDENYFVLEIDNMNSSSSDLRICFSCHAKSKVIFPCQWCHNNGVKITPPKGWQKSEFSWSEYLKYCNATAAPKSCFHMSETISEFQKGMKLEAVNPDNPNQICAATVVRVVEPLLWIHLDNSMKFSGSHIEHCESHNLLPVGWCESNEYQLKPPRILPSSNKKVAIVEPETRNWSNEAFTQMKLGQETGDWCPKIYYNHRCFSGPSLSKGRIAALPKFVGPGPIVLVLKEVLSNLINVAYKSCQVLRELQLEGKPNPNMLQQTIKAKYKGKSYRAIVEICKETSQLNGFCRYICSKLECCPNLISTANYEDSCPEKCAQQTKTQFQCFFGKAKVKKPVGRPPNNPPNGENMPKKRGRKRKYKIMSTNVKGEENGSDGESPGSDALEENDPDKGATSKYKRKYTHHIPPPTEIKTRGAKLPKYSYDRKTHKKILLAHRSHDENNLKIKANRSDMNKKPHSVCVVRPELILDSNPLYWSVSEVVNYIKSTECAQLARILKEQDIDGQALLLLSLPVLQEYLDLKLGPAIKLCHHIEKIKLAFYRQYADQS